MQELASTSGLVVSQRKEWGEILSGFETKNSHEAGIETATNRPPTHLYSLQSNA